MSDPTPGEPDEGGLLLLIDPGWSSTEDTSIPPAEVLLGAWVVTADGERGPFQPNPVYRPAGQDSPLDPVDAVLRRLAQGEQAADLLPSVLRDVTVAIAVDDEGVALVRPAPDGVPSVLVTTSFGHRTRLDVPGWANLTIGQLADALPESGVDVLLNPGGPAAMRVHAGSVRAIAAGAA